MFEYLLQWIHRSSQILPDPEAINTWTWTSLIFLASVLFIFFSQKLFRQISGFLFRSRKLILFPLRLKGQILISRTQIWRGIRFLFRVFHLAISVIIFSFLVDYIFSLFPWEHSEAVAGTIKSLFLVLLLTLILKGLWIFTQSGFNFLHAKVVGLKSKFPGLLKSRYLDLIPTDKIELILIQMIKILRFVGLLFLLLSYFSTVLSLFELTRGWGKILFESILSPVRTVGNSIINYIPNLFFLIAVAFLGYYGIAVIRFLFQEIQKGKLKISGFNKEWSETTYKISRFLFIVFLAIIAFPYLPGADSEAFKGISLFLGVLFSLGSTSVIANIVAGVILTYMLPFRVGDRIQIGETTGDVLEKTLLVTRIRTVKNVVVTIPNSAILGNQIVNFSSQAIPDPIILHISIGLGYDVPWRKVHSVMKRAAAKTNLVLKKPGPFVLQTALDDFFVSYELNVYSDHPHSQAKILSDLMANVLDECAKSDIEIMSPNYLAYRDGNASTIPTDKSGDL